MMEEEALKRRERLKALKKPQNSENPQESNTEEASTASYTAAANESSVNLNKPKFRSYIPKAEELLENVLPKSAPIDVDSLVEDQLLAAEPETVPDNVELTNLAPRKPDWDLKRDVTKSLEKLERRTQRAIAELIRERLATSKDSDLADAVNWVSEAQEKAAYDEWEA